MFIINIYVANTPFYVYLHYMYVYTKQQSSCARATVNNTIFIGILWVFFYGSFGSRVRQRPVHCRGREDDRRRRLVLLRARRRRLN